eukprot:5847901-Ditylum_brightwellii.AAC.1
MFCANFGYSGGNFDQYQRTWNGKYYRMSCKFNSPQVLPTNNEGAVFKQWVDDDKCMVGRDGDWTCAPFQCGRCWFQNLQGSNPVNNSASDKRLLHYIRRFNLDMRWAQA